jgi:hypothetical protein
VIRWRWAPALAVAVCALAFAAFAIDTAPLGENGGLGYDGQHYAWLVSRWRGEDAPAPREPLAYRLVPSGLVAASGLDARVGFLALDVASLAGTALVLLWLLRRYGATPNAAVLAVTLFATLPFTMRAALHLPVLTDAFALFVTFATVAAALARRVVVVAALLVVGALTRESALIVAPFVWIVAARGRWLAPALAATLPAIVAFAGVRVAPPFPPDPAMPSSTALARAHIAWFLLNTSDRAVRFVIAYPLSLGVLALMPLGAGRAARALLDREPEWLYLFVATLGATIVGGVEADRYDVALAPILILIAFSAPARWTLASAGALVALHLVATRAFMPWLASTDSHFAFSSSSAHLGSLAAAAMVAVAFAAAGALLLRRARYSPTNF